ncbi:AraC family transcriptional regulator [Carboxylicivirga marina]|uniref:Helix-turn-helix domain-containing protein n=1 Tax=Carboxylicivirga marina TaxID=2800988 RepID=A0ABS1HF70_9BACT|nr:AraC family transcriptional regulator [Carboxylicivirga marina]MBK3516202.1 helix-turn-helix domain-containing protein [Carboxylicivirga marina]
MESVIREVSPLANDDFFFVYHLKQSMSDESLHSHVNYELNLIINGNGKRNIAGSVSPFGPVELVLVGPETPHAWQSEICNSEIVKIQFHSDFLDSQFLSRNAALPIKELLQKASKGILFSQSTVEKVKDKLLFFDKQQGFDSVLSLYSVLYDLAISRNMVLLSDFEGDQQFDEEKARKISMVEQYLVDNLQRNIKIEEVANLLNMSESAFSHFFKKYRRISFTEYLTSIRVGRAIRLLHDSEHSISEVSRKCGFSNLSNFNRVFKNIQRCTPREFKEKELSYSFV